MPAKAVPKGVAQVARVTFDREGSRQRLLLDASVWAAAVLPEERYHSAAKRLVLSPAGPAAALDLTFYEVANALKRHGRSPEDVFKLTRVIRGRTAGRIVRIDPALMEFVARDAAEHGLTSYDAAYVTVAELNDWTLVSTDYRDLVSKGLAVAPDAAV